MVNLMLQATLTGWALQEFRELQAACNIPGGFRAGLQRYATLPPCHVLLGIVLAAGGLTGLCVRA
jgi:hypothetical protein